MGRFPAKLEIERFGEWLFETFFIGPIKTAWLRSLPKAQGRLRLRLHLDAVPELSRLPWEALYSSTSGFVALQESTPLVRYPMVEGAVRPALGGDVVEILFLGASPNDLPALQIENEWEALSNTLAPATGSRVRLRRAESSTLSALAASPGRVIQALHFAGHGEFDRANEQGIAFLMGEDGRSLAASSHDWTTELAPQLNLRFVLLNSCEGGRHGSRSVTSSLTHSLLRLGVPAVLAMQFPISDEGALALARSFYAELGAGVDLDLALTRARRAIKVAAPEEWVSPILYLRDGGEKLVEPDSDSSPRPVNGGPIARDWPPSVGTSRKRWLSMASLGVAVLLAGLWLTREPLSDLWWRNLRRVSEPPAGRLGSTLRYDPSVRCPALKDLGLELIPVPRGEYAVGADESMTAKSSTIPVQLAQPLCIAKSEVTQAQWRVVMGSNPGLISGDDLPVTKVSWFEAQEFALKIGGLVPGARCSLPTSLQFRLVAGVGKGWPHGSLVSQEAARYRGNTYGNRDGYRQLAPVDQFTPNDWGFYGLMGNAAEWILDDPPIQPSAGTAQGTEKRRIAMGGSYLNKLDNCRSTSQKLAPPTARDSEIGFRVVCEPLPRTLR